MYKEPESSNTRMIVRNTPHLRTILDYIEKNLKKGYKLDDLKYMLLSQGYSRTEVDEAIKIVEEKSKTDKEDARKEELKRAQLELANQKIEPIMEKRGFWSRVFGLD